MNEFSVTPLGTVSPYPNKNSNCPGLLVQSGDKKVLLDCGSGVSRLMKFPDDLKNLVIVISHMHIDHYSDLGSFANASLCYHRLGLLNEKLKVFYPFGCDSISHDIINYINSTGYMDIIPYSSEGYFLDNDQGYCFNQIEIGDMKLSFLENVHDVCTFSVKIVSNEQSMVYTSDTSYNEKLVEFCKGVDLLISESTFLRGQHCTKWHMYAYEAGMLAKNAKVKKLMLTHFWPEIDKSGYVREAKEYFNNVVAAREGKKFILRKGVK